MNYRKSYEFHKNYDGKKHYYDEVILNEKNTTYLTFQQFITLYTADSENWHFIEEEQSYETFFTALFWDWSSPTVIFYIPYYTYEDKTKRYVKFLTKKDYKKFVKTLKDNAKKGLDYENQKEVLELTQSVQKRSSQKLLEAQTEVEKVYNEYRSLVEKATLNLNNETPPWISALQETKKLEGENK